MFASQLCIKLPEPLATFRSIRSHVSPFALLLTFLSSEAGVSVSAAQVTISRESFAEMREFTRRWASRAGRTPLLASFCQAGVTAPLFGSSARRGYALVVLGGVA